MTNGTSVARRDPPSTAEIESIRKAGGAMLAEQREVRELAKQIAGMEWGSGKSLVAGEGFSEATRLAIAQFCRVTRANPMTHIFVLGGKPYLNADYWADLVASDPHYIRYEQRDLSPGVEGALRERAKRHGAIANQLEQAGKPGEAAERRARAIDLEEEADDIALARAQWSPPKDVQVVVETTIFRFMNQAPMEAIKRGDITDIERYIVPVRECNWAGGKSNDPVGNSNPATTARTRSFRRAAVKGFAAWMERYAESIERAETVMEAEWEIIVEDRESDAARLPSEDGPQAVSTSGGEPGAANPAGARPLPGDPEPSEPEEAPEEAPIEMTSPAFDAADARKRLFATLRDAGIADERRKDWASEHGLPRSTKQWGQAEYQKAQDILVGPVKEQVNAAVGGDLDRLEDLSLKLLGKSLPDYLKDWQTLADHLRNDAEAAVPEDL